MYVHLNIFFFITKSCFICYVSYFDCFPSLNRPDIDWHFYLATLL